MAKIKLGASIGDARGAVGAHVFSKNQFGSYIRQKVSPVQPRTTTQNAVRVLFGLLATRWANVLTDIQRAGWKALAAANPIVDTFGDQQILSGLQMYMRVNRNRQLIGGAVIDDSPGNQDVGPVTLGTLIAKVAGPIVSAAFTPAALGADDHIIVFATPLLNQGITFAKPHLRLIFADPAPASASPAVISTPWTAKYGPVAAGQRVGFSAYAIRMANGAAGATVGGTVISIA